MKGNYESALQEHQKLLENQIDLKTRHIVVLQKEISEMQRSHKEVTEHLNTVLCKECKKTTPNSQRLVTTGGIYCLDCGFEVLDLLKGRNNQREQKNAQEEYKEFYESVKNNKAGL